MTDLSQGTPIARTSRWTLLSREIRVDARVRERAYERIALAGILVLGVFLRFYKLGDQNLWFDEAFSLRIADLGPMRIIDYVTQYDVHPPLYYLLLHYWIPLVGDSEIAIRSLSALFASITIVVVYKIGVLLEHPRIGVFASLILALSPFHIRYAQEARSYSLLALLTAVSFYFFIKLLARRSPWDAPLYVFATVALLYTHFLGVFVIAAQACFVLVEFFRSGGSRRKTWKAYFARWIARFGIIVILYAPWIPAIVQQAGEEFAGGPGAEIDHTVSPGNVVGAFSTYLGSKVAVVLFAAVVLIAVAQHMRMIRRRSEETDPTAMQAVTLAEGARRSMRILLAGLWRSPRALLLAVWLVVPLSLLFVLSYVVEPVFESKYTIGFSLALFLLIGLAWTSLRGRRLAWVAAALGVAVLAAGVVDYFANPKKPPWKDVARYVDARASRADLVVFSNLVDEYNFGYYSARPGLETRSAAGELRYVSAGQLGALGRAAESRARVWMVLSGTLGETWGPAMRREVGQSHAEASQLHFGDIDLVLFEPGKL